VRFGGLVIQNIGQLLPVQIHSGCFNTNEYVYPVGVCGCFLVVFSGIAVASNCGSDCLERLVSEMTCLLYVQQDVKLCSLCHWHAV